MKHLTLFVLLSIAFHVNAQTEKELPTITVTGNSQIDVKPDLGILYIGISNKDMEFNRTLTGLNEKTKDVSKLLLSIGFKEGEIKTTDFQIRENRIYRRETYIDSGYVATQNVKVEFNYSKEGITKILNAFSKSKTDFNLNFSFILSDNLKAKSEQDLIKLAIKDATSKGKVISESASVKLKRIQEIRYGQVSSSPRYMADATAMRFKSEASEPMQSFTPEDVTLADTITIIWEIE
jgi:uncharacterized protein YggE